MGEKGSGCSCYFRFQGSYQVTGLSGFFFKLLGSLHFCGGVSAGWVPEKASGKAFSADPFLWKGQADLGLAAIQGRWPGEWGRECGDGGGGRMISWKVLDCCCERGSVGVGLSRGLRAEL